MKIIRKILIILFILALAGGFWAYKSIWYPNVPAELESNTYYIKEGENFGSVVQNLKAEGFLKDSLSFKWVSRLMKFGDNAVKPGKYLIREDWNNRKLISLLRSGEQETVKLTFNQLRKVEDLAGTVAQYIEADSLEILEEINAYVRSNSESFNHENRISIFIPNTYEFYWSTSSKEFLDRMLMENDKFWGDSKRKDRLADLQLSPNEVYTLASIVEKETYAKEEKPTVAGVYLNRLKRGIRLQADPTVVFATGNFELRRVLNKHLEMESPYNTYLNDGLPPGPIFMPDISTIDAVLNAEDHRYLYFCAKPGYKGRHAFAKTLTEHNRNAAEYRRWLNSEKIK
jgi:UPF0755 protein